jgi:hypothetical protein
MIPIPTAMHATRPALVLAALLAACASPAPPRATPPQVTALREFERVQDVFRSQYTGRQSIDFDGHGRVTVMDLSLDGYPGNAYVRCRFQYQNRTAKPVVQAWVSLDVLDPAGEIVDTRTSCLIMPNATAIARGSYFVDELRTPTLDAHLHEGWSWRIRCDAQLQSPDEPLDPPAAEWAPRASEPFIRRSRD